MKLMSLSCSCLNDPEVDIVLLIANSPCIQVAMKRQHVCSKRFRQILVGADRPPASTTTKAQKH